MKIKIFKFILFFIAVLMVLAEGTYLFGVPFFVNKSFADGTFADILKSRTGLSFSSESVKVSAYPDFSMKVNAVKSAIKDKNGAEVVFADKVSAKVSLLPLILKKVNVADVDVKDLKFTFFRDDRGDFYIGSYRLEKDLRLPDVKLSRFNGKITNSQVKFFDYKLNNNIFLNLNDISVKEYKQDKRVSIKANSDIQSNGKKADISIMMNTKLPVLKNADKKDFILKGFVKDFDLSPYSAYAAEFSQTGIKSMRGVIDADFDFKEKLNFNGNVRNFALIMNKEPDSIYAGKAVFVDFQGLIKNEKINFENLIIKGDDWQFSISGLLKNIKSKNPNMDFCVKIPSSNVHSLINMLPSVENTNHAVEKLKKYGVWGNLTGELVLKGALDKPLVYGKSRLSDLHILKEQPIVEPCSMYLDFSGKHVKLYTKVFVDKTKQQYVEVKGTSELKPFGAGEIEIRSSDSVDLKTAHYMLVPIHDIVGFELGPLPFMSLSGRGNIELFTRGTVFDGEAFGRFNFKNTDAVLKGLNTRIEKAEGYLNFDGKDMQFAMNKAKIKGCPATIKGTANLSGHIDFNINSPAILTDELISIVNGSALLESKKAFTEKLKKMEGFAGTNIDLKGIVKNFSDLKDVSDLDFSGTVELKNNSAYIDLLPKIQNINGKIYFDNKNINANLSAKVFESLFSIIAELKNNDRARVNVKSGSVKIDELLYFVLEQNPGTGAKKSSLPGTNAFMSFEAGYHGNPYKINFNNFTAHGQIKPVKAHQKEDLFIKSGEFSLKNNILKLKNFNTAIFNTTARGGAVVYNVFSTSPRFNGNLTILNFNIANFNKLRNTKILPQSIQKALRAYENYEGRADVKMSCVNNKVSGEVRLLNIKFLQSAYKIPITIDSGNIYINNNKISLKSINANFDNVPIFINASLNGLSENSQIKGYFTTKVTEAFVNKYINDRISYPIKPRGDITLTAEISGTPEKFVVEPKLRLEKDADIYYMGANLDDTNDEREINANITVKKNNININGLHYIRYMTSQNDYVYPRKIITVRGNVKQNKDKFILNNLHIVTENNANVKLFNVLFKKSVLKKGMFNCNLLLNGDAGAPKVLGRAGMIDLDMPLYTTLIKDVTMQFTPSVVNVSMNGMSYDSDFVLKTSIRNKPSLPFVIDNLKISSKSFELDNILDSLTQVTLNTGINLDDDIDSVVQNSKKQPDLSNILIKKGEISADKMTVRGLPATNFIAEFKVDRDMILKVDNLKFDVAEGSVSGLAKYDFSTGKTSAEVTAKHVDANRIATALFEAKDQIFGYLNGSMMFNTFGKSEEERINNLSGTVYFEINDGKMPKLGSVEYLLKASSLFKSGITGVSLNNFIDLIAPIKTGYFNSIKGLLLISKGKAKNVEIFSSGDNLSMYIKGSYDIPESFADLNVYGRLTKKADNILGPVGNVSFNSLLNLIPGFKLDKKEKAGLVKELNKIPGVEFNDMQYRIFNAKINGDINSEKYVKYFKWIE